MKLHLVHRAISSWRGTLRRPAVTVGSKTVLIPVELGTGSYLELNSLTDCKVYGPNGELKTEVKPEGELPAFSSGENQIGFRCEADEGVSARANVTVMSEGRKLE